MIRILLKTLILYFSLTTILFSQIINSIDITGNKRISKESIIVFSELNIGNNYSENLINNSLKKLYETNFFEDINITFNDNKLSINVIENPIIEKLELIGIKKKSFLEFIQDNIYLKERVSFNEFYLNKDINLIQNILKTNGYYFSTIQSSLIKNDDLNSVKLKIEINLGEKAKIKKISFIGNKVIKDKKLLEIIASEEHKFWKFVSNKVYLNKTLINLDKRLLENYYKNRGFYNVEIVDNFVELNKENSSFNLTYNINAGNKFLIKNLSLTLPDDYSKEDFTNIDKIFEKNLNENYSLRFINNILEEIENIASNRLYDFIDAKVEEEIVDGNKLNLKFIVSDSKKYYVERINILGNYSTIEEVIRNKLIVDEGDPLNNLLFNKSINEIRSLNIFKTVNSQIKDGSNDNLKILDITVEEQPTGEISLSAGVGTNGVATGGGINERNFLGKGINLNTNLEITEETLKGQIIYSRPNFAYTDNTLFTSLRSVDNDFLTLYGYESTEIGFSIGTKFEQYENLFFSPELDFLLEDLTTNVTASSQLKKQEGNYTDFYFNYGLDYDLRDSSFNTKNGSITKFIQKLPVVSENNEISNTIIYTKYNELIKSSEMVGKASLYLKAINTIDGSDVRVSKRANVPYTRLRGFEKGKVGPVDGSDYIGGNYISTLNLSTNIPGILSTIEILDFNYFIDIGNVWGVDYNSSLDNSKIRSSTGIGLNVLTPVGPLSFSLAQPITKASSDKTETFRFNLGTTF
ncbi:MAG: outer membrane protein assembly factor BamA [Candidatus Pelagibacter sp.]